MKAIGFAGHAPVPFENNFAIENIESLKEYVGEISGLKEKYKEKINILLALEADFIPGVTLDFQHFVNDFHLDYIIGSVHLVKSPVNRLWFIDGPNSNVWKKGLETIFDNDIESAVTSYYMQVIDMINSQKPDIIGHLDKIKMHNQGKYFSEDDPWYIELVSDTLEVISRSDSIVEVNTRGIYKKRSDSLFPGIPVLKLMKQMNIPITISSDAHKPEEVNLLLDETLGIIKEIGYREIYCYESGWKPVPLD